MNLGYSSSSDSDSDETNTETIGFKKANAEKSQEENLHREPVIDVKDIFKISSNKVVKQHRVENREKKLYHAINKVLNEKVETRSLANDKVKTNKKTDNGNDSGNDNGDVERQRIPKDAIVTDLDMNDFYKKNQKEIESGRLNGERQENIGNVVYHRESGHSNAGRLDRVIQFNINNEEKIMFQNKEKIAKEKAIAREKFNAGRG